MKRAVYIGGFGNGRGSAERVADALTMEGPQGRRYDDADTFTFVEAMKDPDTIRRAVQGVDVITHSAGMLALRGTRPEFIGAIGAPLPSTPAKLVMKAVVKTVRMHTPGIGIRSLRDTGCVMAYDLSAIGEFAVHGQENLEHLPEIARFDAVTAAVDAEASGIPVLLGYNDKDEFFRLSHDDALRAVAGGVDITHMPGLHDQLVLTPDETLAEFFAVPAELIGKPPEGL